MNGVLQTAQKYSASSGAGEFRHSSQTGTRVHLSERAIANPAIVGEKQRKNSVGDPANEMEGGRSRQNATREGAPPRVSASSGWLVVSAMEGSLKLCLNYQFR